MKNIILAISLLISALNVTANTFVLPVPIGAIKGAHIEYVDSDTVKVTPGFGECTGFYWEIETDTNLDLTPPTTRDITYLYIDHSASDYPSVVLVETETAPVWSDIKQGFYNGDDRCLGGVYSDDSTTDIREFTSFQNSYFFTTALQAADQFAPDGTWQSSTIDVDNLVPIMTGEVNIRIFGQDIDSQVLANAKAVGVNFSSIGSWGYTKVDNKGWLTTGIEDHSIVVMGQDDDDDELKLQVLGYRIIR